MKRQWKFPIKTSSHISPRSADLATPLISNTLQFWLLLIFEIPSLICSLFIFYKYSSDHIRRTALHNHFILVIIMANILLILTDFSWTLDSLRRSGHVLSATPAFCMIWWFLDISLYNTQTMILAWASIERHILIFHNKMISTTKHKIFYHYLPPTILLIYLFSFYIVVIFLPLCNNEFEFTAVECGSHVCYLKIKFLGIWDLIVNNILPTLIIGIFSLALLYRVIVHKKRLRQPVQWRKYRRMSIQLLSLTAVYIVLNFPLSIIMFIGLFPDTGSEFGFVGQLYVFFLLYSVTLSLPFVIWIHYSSNNKYQHRRISPILTFSQHQRTHTRDVVTIG